MKTRSAVIPTYDPGSKPEYDYARPRLLTIQNVDGLRIIMGPPDEEDSPDVLIERAVGLWRVFVHPNQADPLCIVEIQEDRASVQDEGGEILLERFLH